MYSEDSYLLLSGIQHFAFCRRQWALIHIEGQWSENYRTVEGRFLHERAHDPFFVEKRRDVIIRRDMVVRSRELGVSGQCDVVEFLRNEVTGVSLHGREGLWTPRPVEYKRGRTKLNDCDRLQLTAQALCLEEMLVCPRIDQACLYYGGTRRREYVDLTDELRTMTQSMFAEMHAYYKRGYTPRVKPSKACNACSLRNLCLPTMPSARSVAAYIESALREGTGV
jgi:CRISPR-associated exonuclease Cas4